MIAMQVASLEEGMVVAKPVILQGRTLLSVGAVLTAKHLQLFKAWGVADLWIEGNAENDSADSPDLNSEMLRPVLEKIERRFKRCDKNSEVMNELKRIILLRESEAFQQSVLSQGGLK